MDAFAPCLIGSTLPGPPTVLPHLAAAIIVHESLHPIERASLFHHAKATRALKIL
jgi:hypothetical protein